MGFVLGRKSPISEGATVLDLSWQHIDVIPESVNDDLTRISAGRHGGA
ncbi:hypothetical protein [Streptosporangium amethystogenes]|nr:hypothetical protein [Streptosporangium amethystogenes]